MMHRNVDIRLLLILESSDLAIFYIFYLSHVSLLKRFSIPHLELYLILLLSHIVEFVQYTYRSSRFSRLVAWTDSIIYLSWIVFCSEIQVHIPPSCSRHWYSSQSSRPRFSWGSPIWFATQLSMAEWSWFCETWWEWLTLVPFLYWSFCWNL